MKPWMWWIGGLVVVPALLLVLVALVLQRWVGSDDFRSFIADQVTQAIGAPVELGRVRVDVWPLPAVALEQVRIKSNPPLTLERIEARPSYAPLLAGRLEVATLIVRNAVVPEQAVLAIAGALQKAKKAAPPEPAAPRGVRVTLPRRTALEGITWIGARGTSNTIDATASLDDDGLPRQVEVQVRKGPFEGAKAQLQRQPGDWALRVEIGGGTVAGKIKLDTNDKGLSALQGDLVTSNVELSALTAPSRTLTGKIEATTRLRAEFREPAAIAEVMQTQTRFNVRGAVVRGLDLAQAVKTVGMSRGGETRLDTLAGSINTSGKAAQLNNLVATSGALSATGNISMTASKALGGRITVELMSGVVGGALGVPLVVGGTLEAPTVTLSRGALIGAAIGTAIAPGLGTGGGAKIGDKLGEGLKGLFGK